MIDTLVSIIKENVSSEAILEIEDTSSPAKLIISSNVLVRLCEILHQHESCYFDQLSCLTAIDNGPEAGTLDLVYTLYSIPYNQSIQLQVSVPRHLKDGQNPTVPSVSSIWRTADWHEREAFDLLGIDFTDHPDLRRILLPADWQGHPLRKDYTTQDYYHGVQVDYE